MEGYEEVEGNMSLYLELTPLLGVVCFEEPLSIDCIPGLHVILPEPRLLEIRIALKPIGSMEKRPGKQRSTGTDGNRGDGRILIVYKMLLERSKDLQGKSQ